LMSEWGRSVYDGHSTIHEPPNTQSFDPEKLKAVLYPTRHATAPQTPTSQISNFALMLNSLTSFVGATRSIVSPQTPTRSSTGSQSNLVSTPLCPSPSQLHRYLHYANENLGVEDAEQYEFALQKEHYGPDILSEVPDEDLTSLGIPKGDVRRLKNGSLKWFHSSDAKRKHGELDGPDIHRTLSRGDETFGMDGRPEKHVRYERRWPDGGCSTFHGPPMIEGESTTSDMETVYWDEGIRKYVPVPQGYTVIQPSDELDELFGN